MGNFCKNCEHFLPSVLFKDGVSDVCYFLKNARIAPITQNRLFYRFKWRNLKDEKILTGDGRWGAFNTGRGLEYVRYFADPIKNKPVDCIYKFEREFVEK